MNELLLSSLSTQQLVDLGDDLNVYGQTDSDWDVLEKVVHVLKQRPDCMPWPFWMFD